MCKQMRNEEWRRLILVLLRDTKLMVSGEKSWSNYGREESCNLLGNLDLIPELIYEGR
jgi:hypothetical protein